ncbi:dTDP-4-dehydrorhamnose 3,5-epimerase [Candidatus Pacearchaeota archaeon]|nr:dTDP-4-dehydrorhamnose 3,5-epimerase [Candidatus Pacearchaeota archaeon]
MVFTEVELKGAYVIELELMEDERGFFARSFCQRQFEKRGLNPSIAQCNVSSNRKKGMLRGMHYQVAPHQEAKLVSCLRGSIYDVIIDLRPDSPTYCTSMAVELSAKNYKALYIPEGFAHGFQTLEDDTVVFYQMSEFYYPECFRGIRWNDPSFGVNWPVPDPMLSERDRSHPVFVP